MPLYISLYEKKFKDSGQAMLDSEIIKFIISY